MRSKQEVGELKEQQARAQQSAKIDPQQMSTSAPAEAGNGPQGLREQLADNKGAEAQGLRDQLADNVVEAQGLRDQLADKGAEVQRLRIQLEDADADAGPLHHHAELVAAAQPKNAQALAESAAGVDAAADADEDEDADVLGGSSRKAFGTAALIALDPALMQALSPSQRAAPDDSAPALLLALRQRLSEEDGTAAQILEKLEAAFRERDQQNEVVLADLQRHVAAAAEASSDASKFAASPGDFKLSYGSQDDFTKGLTALVGAPVANASELLGAVMHEHERDQPFEIWSNQFGVMYQVTPLDECRYCLGPAQEGGPSGYKRVLDGRADAKRDAGQAGMTPEAFMQNYVERLLQLMAEVHRQNLASFQQQIGRVAVAARGYTRELRALPAGSALRDGLQKKIESAEATRCSLEQEQRVLRPKLGGLWRQVLEQRGALSQHLLPGQEAEYAREYAALSTLLAEYNGPVAAAANQDLQQLVVNELQRLEVVVLRLYSGPMYKRYNDTARGQVKDAFPTTIALISSGLIKLSKVTVACKVYRGICGGQLPEAFYKPNVFGVKGGIERAFMSTTTELAVASEFAGSKGEGAIGVVYEMEMGMIDRGADLSIMSQYPAEKEILFAPLTGLEVKGTVQKGNVLHIQTRLNTNLKVQTMEEMQSKMKSSHLSMTDILKEDLQGMGVVDLGPLEEHRQAAEAESELKFTDAEFYLSMTQKALARKQDVCQGIVLAVGVAEASDQLFAAAAARITGSEHFATTLCQLDDDKAARFAPLANISEVAFRHISCIDDRILGRLSAALASRPARSISLDLTGDSLTDAIKVLAGEALLALGAGGGASIASVRTDLYTLDEGDKELGLASRNLRLPGRYSLLRCHCRRGLHVLANITPLWLYVCVADVALLAGCVTIFSRCV